MNAKFRFYLLNYLSTRRQRGFALPMVMMVGLVIAVVGATMVLRGMEDKNKAVSQEATSKAQAIAEAGATQYLNFLNSNRALLTYSDCVADRDADGNCPDASTVKSWSQISNIVPSPLPQSGVTACAGPVVGSTSTATAEITSTWANGNKTSGWKSVSGGRYRLVGYRYNGLDLSAPNVAPGVSTLAIQGEARSPNGQTLARSQLSVTLPVTTILGGKPPIPQVNPPGLWARSFNTAANAHANVLDSSGCGSGNTAFPSAKVGRIPTQPLGALPNGNKTPPLSTTNGVLTKDTQGTPFPPLPYYPTASEFTTLVTASKVNQLSDCASKTAYPAVGDKDADGNTFSTASSVEKVYKYRITGNCTLPSNVTFGSSSGKDRIIIYVDGNLDIGNNAKIGVNAANKTKVSWLLKTSDLDLGGNSQVGTAAPGADTAQNWAFFLYEGTLVSLRGTPDYYAFIFAPKAEADLRGNPKIGGALWVNSFLTKGAPPKVFQAIFKDGFNDLFSNLYKDTGTDISALATPNLLGQAVSYNKQEVDSPVLAPALIPTPAPVAIGTPPPAPPTTIATCTVPTIKDMTLTDLASLDAVRNVIFNAGLSEGTATLATTGDNKIQSQTPASGTTADCGTAVNYTYKLPVATSCTVPSIDGDNTSNSGQIAQVIEEITDAGFIANGTVNNSLANKKVYYQSPTAGTVTTCGTKVSYQYK